MSIYTDSLTNFNVLYDINIIINTNALSFKCKNTQQYKDYKANNILIKKQP